MYTRGVTRVLWLRLRCGTCRRGLLPGAALVLLSLGFDAVVVREYRTGVGVPRIGIGV